MATNPLLLFKSPRTSSSARLPSAQTKVKSPTPKAQYARFKYQFKKLSTEFSEFISLHESIDGLAPEKVLVIEVCGSIQGFMKSIERVDGFQFIKNITGDDVEDESIFIVDKDGNRKSSPSNLYMSMSNREGLEKLLRIWKQYKETNEVPFGMSALRDAFMHLRGIRFWGTQDRIEHTRIKEDWEIRLSEDSEELIPLEIELWYRKSKEARYAAEQRAIRLVEGSGGIVCKTFEHEGIAYHGVLAKISRVLAQSVLDGLDSFKLVRCDDAMYFWPVGQCAFPMPEDEGLQTEEERNHDDLLAPDYFDKTTPVIALFDGLPVANHESLKNHVVIEDPDEFESRYKSNEQCHGTAMASLIVHGDIENPDPEGPLQRPIYIRPIMAPVDAGDSLQGPRQEAIPEDHLPIDLLHRAVRRLFEESEGTEPSAPTVKIINLSIGDPNRLFEHDVSPLARMIDWLAYKYRVLFVLSGGNHTDRIVLNNISLKEFNTMTARDREVAMLDAVNSDRYSRRMMSPAEAINALTVKSVHSDFYDGVVHYNLIDPIATPNMVSLYNPITLGKNRSIKPELLMPGGRQTYVNRTMLDNEPVRLSARAASPYGPGQKVACPGPHGGDLSRYLYSTGTSNSAALTTRRLGQLYETLQSLKEFSSNPVALKYASDALILKALIIHGAQFEPDAVGELISLYKEYSQYRVFKSELNQYLGYGLVDEKRIHACTDQQATLLHSGILKDKESHIYDFPLPDCLALSSELRRVIVTVAWFSPINAQSAEYNGAKLWVSGVNKQKLKLSEGDYYHPHLGKGSSFHVAYKGDEVSDLDKKENIANYCELQN